MGQGYSGIGSLVAMQRAASQLSKPWLREAGGHVSE